MRTAMQDLREDILTSVLLSTQTKTIVCAFIDNHLEKEITQIIEAGHEGYIKGYCMDVGWTAEDYYNETYDNKGQA